MPKVKSSFRREGPILVNRAELQHRAIQVLHKKYDFLAIIGSGAFSDIMAVWSREQKITLAAKVLHPRLTSKGEIKLWPRLNHYNIVPVLKIKRRPDVDIFLMPHYSRTLMSVLEEDCYLRSGNSFAMTRNWMTDILCGLEYLHESGICHLDLKADNVMITAQNTAAIGDFSCIEKVNGLTNRYALPRYYCPPEAWPLEIDGPLPKVDGKAFDVWSAGMVILYCFSDRWMEAHLWGRTNWWDEIFPLVFQCLQYKLFCHQLSQAFPYSAIDIATFTHSMNLVKGVLRYKPEDRPTPTQILNHIMLKGTQLLEPDVIWTYQKKEVQEHILHSRLSRIINTAVVVVNNKKDGKRKKGENSKSDRTSFNFNQHVQTSLQRVRHWCWLCCTYCCRKQDEK